MKHKTFLPPLLLDSVADKTWLPRGKRIPDYVQRAQEKFSRPNNARRSWSITRNISIDLHQAMYAQ